MALLALATRAIGDRPRLSATLMAIGVFGASLFYGDAVLTPAISVLSAVEGIEIGTAAFKPYVVPISTGILIALFLIQKHGTGLVGLLFGPVCVLWFAAIGACGLSRNSSGDPNSSFVPLTKSVGTLNRGKCSVRNDSGFFGGWSGYEMHTTPATSSASSTALAAIEHIRPPIDRPPMTRSLVEQPSDLATARTSRRTVASNTGVRSGNDFPALR